MNEEKIEGGKEMPAKVTNKLIFGKGLFVVTVNLNFFS